MFTKTCFVVILIIGISTTVATAQCQLPESFSHFTTVIEGDLQSTFANESSTHEPGDIIHFKLIFQNVGNEAMVLNWPVHPGFIIVLTPVDCACIYDCLDDLDTLSPTALMYVPGSETLAPGECRIIDVSYDSGASPIAEGQYTVWGGMYAYSSGEEPWYGQWMHPANGAPLPFQMMGTISTVESSWGNLKSLYK